MKANLQINLIVSGQPCLVIGGNSEAEEKTGRLLDAFAVVTVISPTLTQTMEEWTATRRIKHIAREYEEEDEEGMRLVLLCEKNAYYAELLFDRCHEQGILMSAWDQVKIAHFNFPALIRSGPIRIAISSGGQSPGLSASLRKLLEKAFDDRFGRYARWVGERRSAIANLPPEQRFQAYKSLTEGLDLKAEIQLPPAWEKTEQE